MRNWTAMSIQSHRLLSTTSCVERYNTNKNIRAATPKITPNRSKKLTYDEANFPYTIGVRKSWNSWNTGMKFESCFIVLSHPN